MVSEPTAGNGAERRAAHLRKRLSRFIRRPLRTRQDGSPPTVPSVTYAAVLPRDRRDRRTVRALLDEAEELIDTILSELKEGGTKAERWRSELQPELNAYVALVIGLLQTRRSLERAGERTSAADVSKDLAEVICKLKKAGSPDLQREYHAAVVQHERQLTTLRDLQQQIEMIDLRVNSAVLALRQVALDLPRLRTDSAGESAALKSLRGKSQELTQYLDDLRTGHQELGSL